MRKGIVVRLTGAHVVETAHALAKRVVELGHNAELLDDSVAARLGGAESAAYASHLLSRNGVVVIAVYAGARPEGACLTVEVATHDTADFAAEKALDALAEAGVIALDDADYTPEEEARIRDRLADLGYIE